MVAKVAKWGRAFWADLTERVLTAAAGGGLTLLTANNLIHVTPQIAWTIVGVPSATSLLKGLIANLSGTTPSASLVNVDSSRGPPSVQLKAAAAAAEHAALQVLDTSAPSS